MATPASPEGRAGWMAGYEFALTHLSDAPVQADRARYLEGRTDTAPDVTDEGGEGKLAERIDDAIDGQLEEDRGTVASTRATEAVMAIVAPILTEHGGAVGKAAALRVRVFELRMNVTARNERIAELEESERTLRALVDDLADPEPCRYDHHGYCQEHGWFDTDPPCVHARAQKLTAQFAYRATKDTAAETTG